MEKLKLFTLLKKLKTDEVSAFHKHLKQLRGKASIPIRVFDYARKLHPDFKDKKKMDIDYAYRKIFGKPDLDPDAGQTNLFNTLSDLYLLLREFLIAEKIRKDKRMSELLWLDFLQERGFKVPFAKQTGALYEKMTTQSRVLSESYMKNAGTALLQFKALAQNTKSPDIEAMQQCLDILKIYIETIQVKMECQLATVKKLRPASPEEEGDKVQKEPEHITQDAMQKHSLLLEVYKDIREMIEHDDEDLFNKIEKTFIEYIDRIEIDELQNMMGYLRNFIAGKLRKDRNSPWAAKLHQLNRFRLQYDPYARRGIMTITQFTNIVNTACAVGEIVWAESFVAEYGSQLPANIQDAAVKLSEATILFEKKKFEEVIDLLNSIQQADIKEIVDEMRFRMLMLRCYFELKRKSDFITHYCIAFEAMLLRANKPKKEHVEAALEFVRICKMILKMNTNKEKLIELIKGKPMLYVGNWLIEQAEKYKNEGPEPAA